MAFEGPSGDVEAADLQMQQCPLESQCEQAPVLPADGDLREWRGRIELAVAHAAPEQLIEPLGHPTGVGADDLRTRPAGRQVRSPRHL